MNKMLELIILSLAIFIFNIPFGYWRANVKKFSFQWVLSVHIPVPFIILARIFSDVGFAWYTYVFFVSAFFLGQKLGSIIRKKFINNEHNTTSCLVMDLFRNCCV